MFMFSILYIYISAVKRLVTINRRKKISLHNACAVYTVLCIN